MRRRGKQPMGQFSVIRNKQKPLRVLIQPAHGEKLSLQQGIIKGSLLLPHQLKHCFVMVVLRGGYAACRLVQHEVNMSGIGNTFSVYTDLIGIFLYFHLRTFDREAVYRNLPFSDKRLYLASCTGFHIT